MNFSLIDDIELRRQYGEDSMHDNSRVWCGTSIVLVPATVKIEEAVSLGVVV